MSHIIWRKYCNRKEINAIDKKGRVRMNSDSGVPSVCTAVLTSGTFIWLWEGHVGFTPHSARYSIRFLFSCSSDFGSVVWFSQYLYVICPLFHLYVIILLFSLCFLVLTLSLCFTEQSGWISNASVELCRCLVRISVETPIILNEVCRDFPQSLQSNAGMVP
jgi:hypothetical protein